MPARRRGAASLSERPARSCPPRPAPGPGRERLPRPKTIGRGGPPSSGCPPSFRSRDRRVTGAVPGCAAKDQRARRGNTRGPRPCPTPCNPRARRPGATAGTGPDPLSGCARSCPIERTGRSAPPLARLRTTPAGLAYLPPPGRGAPSHPCGAPPAVAAGSGFPSAAPPPPSRRCPARPPQSRRRAAPAPNPRR